MTFLDKTSTSLLWTTLPRRVNSFSSLSNPISTTKEKFKSIVTRPVWATHIFLFTGMKFQLTESSDTKSLVRSEMDSLSNKISEKLTLRCRHSPIKMRKTMISQRTRVCNEFDETHSYLPIKCRKCFSRNCSCTDKQKVDVNSLTTLRKLLREQTLIQEAVRRLKIKTSSSKELEVDHYKSFEGNSECISHYTSYDSESDLDC